MLATLVVLPGSGHFMFRRWLRGTFWALTFCVAGVGVLVLIGLNFSRFLTVVTGPGEDLSALYPLFGRLFAALGVCAVIYVGAALDTALVVRSAEAKEVSLPGTPTEPTQTEGP